MANSFGTLFTLTTFGESHGSAMGGIIDGCPSGLTIDLDYIQHQLNLRQSGKTDFTSTRQEADIIEILSGVYEGKTLGTPIGFIIKNCDQHSNDYHALKEVYRPSHADFTYEKKYQHRDHRGGGRASAREHVIRVAAGAIAKLILKHYGISITAWTKSIGNIGTEKPYNYTDKISIETSPLFCPDAIVSEKIKQLLSEIQSKNDSIGGTVSCVIEGMPSGIGEPIFDRLQADLAKAMLSINAAKGFEYGEGFNAAKMRGSEHNDSFTLDKSGNIVTTHNHSGGIQGGISNGNTINFNVAFKPVASIGQEQETVTKNGTKTKLTITGRHDVCVVPRAVPVVEAMAALVIVDHLLRNRSSQI